MNNVIMADTVRKQAALQSLSRTLQLALSGHISAAWEAMQMFLNEIECIDDILYALIAEDVSGRIEFIEDNLKLKHTVCN
jgi:hypothetical protein